MTGWVEARRSTQISTQNLGRDHGIRRPPGAQQGGPLPRHVQGRGWPLPVRRHLQHRGAGARGRFVGRAARPDRWPCGGRVGSGHPHDTDDQGARAAVPPASPGRGKHQGEVCGHAAPTRDPVPRRLPTSRDRPDGGAWTCPVPAAIPVPVTCLDHQAAKSACAAASEVPGRLAQIRREASGLRLQRPYLWPTLEQGAGENQLLADDPVTGPMYPRIESPMLSSILP